MSQANQTIVLSKRHNPNCKVHKTRLPHAARRFCMECGCPIWIVGRTPRGDLVPRQSTRFSDLKQAEAVRASLIARTKGETVHGPTIAECAEKYIASRRHELGEKTIGQHRLLLDRLEVLKILKSASRGLSIQELGDWNFERINHQVIFSDDRATQRNN